MNKIQGHSELFHSLLLNLLTGGVGVSCLSCDLGKIPIPKQYMESFDIDRQAIMTKGKKCRCNKFNPQIGLPQSRKYRFVTTVLYLISCTFNAIVNRIQNMPYFSGIVKPYTYMRLIQCLCSSHDLVSRLVSNSTSNSFTNEL